MINPIKALKAIGLLLLLAVVMSCTPIDSDPQALVSPASPNPASIEVNVHAHDPGVSRSIDTRIVLPAPALHKAAHPHRIAEANIIDTRERRQVQLTLVLAEILPRPQIVALLENIEKACETLYEFLYFTHIYGPTQPTHIFIDVYASDAHFETRNGLNRVAGLSRTPKDLGDRTSFRRGIKVEDAHIADLTEPGEVRFGYTREERMAIYSEYRQGADRAQQLADERFPLPEFTLQTRDHHYAQSLRNHDYSTELQVQSRADIAHKHILSPRAMGEIMREGMEKGWPE